jgi:hypothetical protein
MDRNIIYLIYNMSRVFSRQQTNSYSDVLNKKKRKLFRCINLPINNNIHHCQFNNICENAPINLIQGKTSYICFDDTNNNLCKNFKLYPYGFYLCGEKACSITDVSGNGCNGCTCNNSTKNTYDLCDLFACPDLPCS